MSSAVPAVYLARDSLSQTDENPEFVTAAEIIRICFCIPHFVCYLNIIAKYGLNQEISPVCVICGSVWPVALKGKVHDADSRLGKCLFYLQIHILILWTRPNSLA